MKKTCAWFSRASASASLLRKVFLFVACLAWLPVATSGQSNPILRGADPDVLLVDGTFWLYSTGARGRFYVHSSTNLDSWERHGPILDFARIPWIPDGKHPWAPGVIQHDGRFYFYFSCGPKPSSIGVAIADHPAGPFVDSGRPLLQDEGNPGFEAIDAMVFRDSASDRIFLYCGGSAGSRLRVFEMSDDLLGFTREIEVETPRHFTEGAYMHRANGRYYLSYSHGSWRHASYSVHYATGDSPVGPWEYQGTILTSNNTYKGPGHHSFLHVPATDERLIFYHRYENESGDGPYRSPRHIAVERFQYFEDGRIAPIVMSPGPGDRNPDNLPHAKVTGLRSGVVEVRFEDLHGLREQKALASGNAAERAYAHRNFLSDVIVQFSGGVTADAAVMQALECLKDPNPEVRNAAAYTLKVAYPQIARSARLR